ncbi:major facilitator superfamily domain-containing protein [Chaetomium tenue]|uniref:Major facilitator superfamily domain-containing protein n=1 Tax=Chaetomium tenue TaxID=1854479 RepID=A0ACB7P9F8_9PEZI|nr:major facilitator superfamily domain-containing protein [Chaetomium globosum]
MAENGKRQSREGDDTNMEKVEKKREQSLSDSSSTAGSVHVAKVDKESAVADSEHDQSGSTHPDGGFSSSDFDTEEAKVAVPGHDLDVELAQVSSPFTATMTPWSLSSIPEADHSPNPQHPGATAELSRSNTRNSTRSRISRIISRKRTAERERIPHAPIPLSNLDEGIVGWESQDDPAMPLNFPSSKKWLIVGLLSGITLLTPFASSILAPGISTLSKEFGNTNQVIGAMTVSVYLLGYVIGPLFLAPLSELYGRRPVLAVANVFFCLWLIGCALAPSIESLIVFRFFSGIGGSGCLTLGAGVIADVFRTDQRGSAIGMYTLGPLIGPTIGPVLGSWLSQTIGWRWDFWIVFIISVIVVGLFELFTTETNPRILIKHKVARLQKELNRPDLRSCYETPGAEKQTPTQTLINGLIRPTKMLFLSPTVFFISLYLAFAYGTLYLLFTTIPTVFQQTYGWSVGITGLVYICLGVGNVSGWAVITATSDRGVVKRTRANGGVFEPEMRLPLSIYFSFLLPVTFFWYGWSTYYRTHWIVPVLGLFPFSFGVIGIFLPLMTYLVDSFPVYAASAMAANTVFRSLVGMLLPLAGPSMYANLGLGMQLSPIWRSLPDDLAEQVFALHVKAHFFTDPAYTWTQLRHLSAHQKRVVERRFQAYWLPKLSISLYASASHRFDYGMGEDTQQATTATTSVADDGSVVFAMQRQVHNPLAGISQDLGLGRFTRKYLRKAWGMYDPAACRNITVRLGEGVLSGGCRGGYILNDTHLPGVELLEGGGIRFDWKGAIDELLREEMYMRKAGEKMFNDACDEWLASNPQDLPGTDKERHGSPPLNIQFRVTSKWLHDQEPDGAPINTVRRWLFVACPREQPPDIFEVAEVEESVVPMMQIFQTWLRQQPCAAENDLGEVARDDIVMAHTIIDLYRKEFAWRAWIRYSKRDEQDDQQLDEDTDDEFMDYEQNWTGPQALLLGDEKLPINISEPPKQRKNILIAEIMTSFRDLVNHAAAPVDSTASTGQTAYSSLAMGTKMSSIIKSTEDLLSLTRKIRELWLIGALKPPGAQDAAAEQAMQQDAEQVFAMLNALRDRQRQGMLQQAAGGGFAYEQGAVDGPAPPLQQAQSEGGGSQGPAQASLSGSNGQVQQQPTGVPSVQQL